MSAKEAFGRRMEGGYEAPILAEPVGGPIPVWSGSSATASALWSFAAAGPTTRQASVSADDVGVITDQWAVVVDELLIPALAANYTAAATAQQARLSDVLAPDQMALFSLPLIDVQEAAQVVAMDSRPALVGIGDVLASNARTSLTEGMALGESVPKLAARVQAAAGVSAARATVIARTESMAARNWGAYDEMTTAASLGLVAAKTWLATHDARTRLDHVGADGQSVPFNAKFTVGGWPADRPHDPMLPAEQTVSCRCTLLFQLSESAAAGIVPPSEASDKLAAARTRQADIDVHRPKAEVAGDFAETLNNLDLGAAAPSEADVRLLLGQIDAAPKPVVRELVGVRSAVKAGDLRTARVRMQEFLDRNQLSQVGEAGQLVGYDPKAHELIGDRVPVGSIVEIIRPGYSYLRGYEVILLSKAVVTESSGVTASLWNFGALLVARGYVRDSRGRFAAAGGMSGAEFDTAAGKAASGDEAVRMARVNPTDPGQRRAIDSYAGGAYDRVNGGLRAGGGTTERLSPFEQEVASRLDSVMAEHRLSGDIVVTRGLASGRRTFGGREPTVGTEWTDHAYVSTTAAKHPERTFTGESGVEMRILVPKGTHAFSHSHLDPDEVVLDRGLTFRVVADHGVDSYRGTRQLDVEVVGGRSG